MQQLDSMTITSTSLSDHAYILHHLCYKPLEMQQNIYTLYSLYIAKFCIVTKYMRLVYKGISYGLHLCSNHDNTVTCLSAHVRQHVR